MCSLALQYEKQKKYETALDMYHKSLATKEKLELTVSTAITQDNIGGILRRQGKFQQAVDMHEKALKTRVALLGPDHPSVSDTMTLLGRAFMEQKMYLKSFIVHRKAFMLRLKIYGHKGVEIAESLIYMAHIRRAQFRFREALHLYEMCLTINTKVHGRRHEITMENARLVSMMKSMIEPPDKPLAIPAVEV